MLYITISGLAYARRYGTGTRTVIRAVIGYMILAWMTAILFALTLLEPYHIHGVGLAPVLGIVVLGILLFEAGREFSDSVVKAAAGWGWERRDAFDFAAVAFAALVTFSLSVEYGLGLGAVVASSAVGIAVALIKPSYAVPAFCGSFAGMACGTTFSPTALLLAALLAAMIYVLGRNVFNGFGGKLGTVAFAGCAFAALISRGGFATAAVPDSALLPHLVMVSVLGAVVTYSLTVRLRLNVVLSSGLVGLAAGIALPVMDPVNGPLLAVMAFCASFAGMSARQRLANELSVVVAGVICAVIFMYAAPHLGGAGGKLGTIAFGSAIIVFGMQQWSRLLARAVLPESMLLQPLFTEERCTQCARCKAACPLMAIEQDEYGMYLENVRSCNGCLACVQACENSAIQWGRGRSGLVAAPENIQAEGT